jgi:hypothetical protein
MGFQFDDLAKDLARGVSRRRVVSILLGGVASSVASLWHSGGKTEAAGIPMAGASGASYLTSPEHPLANQTLPVDPLVPATQAGRIYVPGRAFFTWQPGTTIRSGYVALPWVRIPVDQPRATTYEDASFTYSRVTSQKWTATRKSTTPLFNQGTVPLYGGIKRYYDSRFRYDVSANGQWAATAIAAIPTAERPKIRATGGSYCDATYCFFSAPGGDWIAISAATTSSGTPVMNQTAPVMNQTTTGLTPPGGSSSLLEADGGAFNVVGAPNEGSISNQASSGE